MTTRSVTSTCLSPSGRRLLTCFHRLSTTVVDAFFTLYPFLIPKTSQPTGTCSKPAPPDRGRLGHRPGLSGEAQVGRGRELQSPGLHEGLGDAEALIPILSTSARWCGWNELLINSWEYHGVSWMKSSNIQHLVPDHSSRNEVI